MGAACLMPVNKGNTVDNDILIPVRKLAQCTAVCRLPKSVVLCGTKADGVPLRQLADELKTAGVDARSGSKGAATISVTREKGVAGAEAYRLEISPGRIDIAASADAGAYYGVQTLREMIRAHGRTLPVCRIDDAPDFPRRGYYLDCSRGRVPTLERLKALVDLLAHWKINEVQLYIENVFTFKKHPLIGRGYSPFTPAELLALQDHCEKHHVRFVGSLSSFGHMEKILQIPKYQHLGELQGHQGYPGGTTLCPTDPGSIRLLGDLYSEFVPLFKAEDFNICGDEPWELGKGRGKRRADKIGVGRVYLEFLLRIHRLCRKYGKRMNAWADIVLDHPELLGELPRDVVMLNWDYDPDGRRIPRSHEITDAGLPLVVCPGTNAWNTHGCRLKMGMENIAIFAREGMRRGAEGVLNTDWGDNGHRNMLAVSLHNIAYGAAQSWHGRGVRDEGFTSRFCAQTFGVRSAAFAQAIRTLGSRVPHHSPTHRSGNFLYECFMPMVDWGWNAYQGGLDTLPFVDDADLKRHGAALGKLRWPDGRLMRSRFLAGMIEEFRIAAELDALACSRCRVMKRVVAGGKPRAADVRAVLEQTRETAADLRRVWLLGNKPSLLRRHLAGLDFVVKEYGKFL